MSSSGIASPAESALANILPRSWRKRPWWWVPGRILLYVGVAYMAYIFVWPLLWLVSSSLKGPLEIYRFPPTLIPDSPEWSNIPTALADFNFLRGLQNTMLIVVGVLIGRLASCSLVAYGFARLEAPYKNALFVIVLSTMMLPYYVTLIPQFILFKEIGWLNTFYPLIVPSFFATNAYIIFLLRQFFLTIPREYDDAAEIDGCNKFGIYWRIILPQVFPALGVVAILTYMSEWNDFLAPLIYLNDQEKMTLAVAMKAYQTYLSQPGSDVIPTVYIMAVASMMTVIPVIVFFFAQRYFIQGMVISGIKG